MAHFVTLCVIAIGLAVKTECACLVSGASAITVSTCIPGMYCGNNSAQSNSVCPATDACLLTRLTGKFCSKQGDYDPEICQEGYYCPTPWQKLECPSGYFCVKGTANPVKCPAMAHCPAGSHFKREFLGIFLLGLGYLAATGMWLWRRSKNSNQVSPTEKYQVASPGLSPGVALGGGEEVGKERERAILKGFVDANNGAVVIVMKFDHLQLTIPSKNLTILDDVSGSIFPGKLTAIMGPSGAGKSCLLDMLQQRTSPELTASGQITLNGKPYDAAKFLSKIGFVPQQDIMMENLTVYENLHYSASIRLPSWSDDKITVHVDNVLQSLELHEIHDSLIGTAEQRGISGGQRKRVSVGMELAAAPVLLILDEPTSGLDATAALKLCKLLKNLASKTGMTILAVVHQPRREIVDEIDDLILLERGRTAYVGPFVELQSHFEAQGVVFGPMSNPIDVVMDHIQTDAYVPQAAQTASGEANTGERLSMLAALDEADDNGDNVVDMNELKMVLDRIGSGGDTASQASLIMEVMDLDGGGTLDMDEIREWTEKLTAGSSGASFLHQFWLAHNRAVQQQLRSYGSLMLEIGLSIIIPMAIGGSLSDAKGNLYQGILKSPGVYISPSTNEYRVPLTAMILNLSVGASAAAAGCVPWSPTLPVYWRETAAGHNPLSYYCGVSVSLIWRLLISALHFATVFQLVGVPIQAFGNTFILIYLLLFCTYGMAAVVSMTISMQNTPLASTIVALFLGCLCGFGPKLSKARDTGYGWLLEMNYCRWFAEGFYTLELEEYDHIFQTDTSADIWGYEMDRLAMDVGLMILYGFILRAVAFGCMIGLNRDKQR